ncbi:MAG: hypothetical protein WB392_08475 [Methanotrichaceae archaeon]
MKKSIKVGMMVVLAMLLAFSLSIAFAGNDKTTATKSVNMINVSENITKNLTNVSKNATKNLINVTKDLINVSENITKKLTNVTTNVSKSLAKVKSLNPQPMPPGLKQQTITPKPNKV